MDEYIVTVQTPQGAEFVYHVPGANTSGEALLGAVDADERANREALEAEQKQERIGYPKCAGCGEAEPIEIRPQVYQYVCTQADDRQWHDNCYAEYPRQPRGKSFT